MFKTNCHLASKVAEPFCFPTAMDVVTNGRIPCFYVSIICICKSHIYLYILFYINTFPDNSVGKESACNMGAAKSLQSCPTLCNPIDSNPPGSPVPGILQARTLEWSFLLQCIKVKSESEVAQSCLTLHDPMDCSPRGFSVHGIFQARVLEWGAIAFSGNVGDHVQFLGREDPLEKG